MKPTLMTAPMQHLGRKREIMSKLYKIAGLTVQMEIEGRTDVQAEPYRIFEDLKPDMVMDCDYRAYYAKYPNLELDDARYVSAAIEFYYRLIDFDGLMLHSSAVVVDNKAYLFSAASGTGKSTHTKLWLEKFGDRAFILNDDKPALRLIDGVWYACGTPWSGKHDISKPVCVPLAGIAFLYRDTTNHIEPFKGAMVPFELLNQMSRSKDKINRILELLDQLVSQIPVWKLYCNMEPEAADVSYNAMSGNVKE